MDHKQLAALMKDFIDRTMDLYCTEGAPDIICTGADDLALGAVDALEDAGHVLERMVGL